MPRKRSVKEEERREKHKPKAAGPPKSLKSQAHARLRNERTRANKREGRQGIAPAAKRRKQGQREGNADDAMPEPHGLALGLRPLPAIEEGIKVEWTWPPGHINQGTLTSKQTAKSVQRGSIRLPSWLELTKKSGANKYLPKSRYSGARSDIPNAWWLVI